MNIFFQLFGLLAVTIAQSRGRRALYPDDRDNSSHIIPDRDLTHSLPAEISMAVNEVGDSFLLPSSEGVDLEFEKYSNGKRSIDVTLGELQKEQTKPDEIDKSYLTRLNEQFFNLRVIGNYVATVCGALSSLVNLEARDVLANKLMADYILLREAALNSATEDALAYHQDDRYEKAVDIFTLVINEKKESVNPVDYYWRGLSYFHLQK
ncbi:MAG TPA: hypothetical protein VD770_01320, partial [Coxiellaceae bacterium]|nr:hypothetical protein [Coxiellaceae bacterium]